ncbi:MAG: hypothetical protein K9N05_05280 [Candidatus Marinimicrobia bacterium]|nr:hypothetical protein [Candidatus Neomarinimicrobiota bacterium]
MSITPQVRHLETVSGGCRVQDLCVNSNFSNVIERINYLPGSTLDIALGVIREPHLQRDPA